MKNTGMMRNMVAGVLLVGWLFGAQANAASVVYEDVGFIRGVGFESDSFMVSADGTYRASLTDFNFPVKFDELNFTITTLNADLTGMHEIDSLSGAGWFDFEASSGITYYANVHGVAGGRLDLGLYGIGVAALNAPVSSVPLPAPLLLLSSALVVIGAFGRGGRGAGVTEDLPGAPQPA
jgi:hypothetical protein